MDLRSTTIDGRLVNIISEEKYGSMHKVLIDNPQELATLSMDVTDKNGNQYILPFRGKSDDRPGIYTDGSLYFINFPKDSESSPYNVNNLDILDFSDVNNINDFLNKSSMVREMENSILSDPDEIFTATINGNETPQMKVMKDAINLKRCDIDKYSLRAGPNHLNNKRILKGDDITIKKMVEICDYMDMEVELTIRDKNPDVANPMGKEVTRILTTEGDDTES
jgi:hypothetical protein